MSDYENERLTPEQFAQKLYDEGKFVVLVWDLDKFRLGQRIEALMKLGYSPVSGTMVSHTVYEKQGSSSSSPRIPVKEDLCLMMINKSLLNRDGEDE